MLSVTNKFFVQSVIMVNVLTLHIIMLSAVKLSLEELIFFI
jgi:hypothetical protein